MTKFTILSSIPIYLHINSGCYKDKERQDGGHKTALCGSEIWVKGDNQPIIMLHGVFLLDPLSRAAVLVSVIITDLRRHLDAGRKLFSKLHICFSTV